MFISALFTIAKLWKQPKCPSIGEWMKKLWYLYTMKYYSAIGKNKILPLMTVWVDLEGIMLSEVSPSEKDTRLLKATITGTLEKRGCCESPGGRALLPGPSC